MVKLWTRLLENESSTLQKTNTTNAQKDVNFQCNKKLKKKMCRVQIQTFLVRQNNELHS